MGAVTVKLRLTAVAAAYLESPACIAETVHVPAATSVRVLPETAHAAVVALVKLTANPDDALAVNVIGATFTS